VGIFRSLLRATTAAHVISAEGAKSNEIIALKGPPNFTRTSTPALPPLPQTYIPDAAALSARAPSRHRVK
jgi:hypothetical protein